MLAMKDNKQLHFGVKNYRMAHSMHQKQEEISHLLKTISSWKHFNTTNTIKIDKYIIMLQYPFGEFNIQRPDGIFGFTQWIPFHLYEKLPHFPRYAPNPFLFSHISF